MGQYFGVKSSIFGQKKRGNGIDLAPTGAQLWIHVSASLNAMLPIQAPIRASDASSSCQEGGYLQRPMGSTSRQRAMASWEVGAVPASRGHAGPAAVYVAESDDLRHVGRRSVRGLSCFLLRTTPPPLLPDFYSDLSDIVLLN